MTILTIDIGGTKLAAALFSIDNELTQRSELSTPNSDDPQLFKDALKQLITPYLGKFNRVAVASTGIINKGVLTALNPDNLGGLNQFPLQIELESLTGVPCLAINDAQAAAWAEYQATIIKPSAFAFITISTGVGGGLIVNNQLLVGQNAFAGHIGHTQFDPNGPRCGCGRQGCIEAVASGRAIAEQATGELQGLNSKAIFSLADQGNQQAEQLRQTSVKAIASLIANLKATIDVDLIAIGGSVGLAKNYLPLIQSELESYPIAYQVPLIAAHYHHDAGLMGAALWAKQNQ